MVAVDRKEGDEAVRLHAEAIANFERQRVKIVNPALVSRPRAMELKLPPIASPAPDDFDITQGPPWTLTSGELFRHLWRQAVLEVRGSRPRPTDEKKVMP